MRYHGAVKAHVPDKEKLATVRDHKPVQHCASQVNLCMEFGKAHKEAVAMFSCDDMNKINVGPMPVPSDSSFLLRRGYPQLPGPRLSFEKQTEEKWRSLTSKKERHDEK